MTASPGLPASDFEALESCDIPTVLGRLRVRAAGQGPALLFWSSLLMSGRMWGAQAAHFRDRYRVVLVDPPGHGDSEPLARDFTFEECARCVVQVLDALGIERTHYVGNSWGGMIGGTFAARHPERLLSSVLMNCTASPVGVKQKIEYTILTRALRLIGGIRGPMARLALNAFVGPTTRRERPEVIATIRTALARIDADSVYWAIRSVVPQRPDQRALMRQIKTPVLVIAGEEDRTFPVAETKAMADAIPGAQFIVMRRTAHLAGLENPAEVNRMIEEFLAARQSN